MRLLIQHKSHYGYEKPASLGTHQIRLRPAAHTKARVETYSLSLSAENKTRWQFDAYGNRVARIEFPEKVKDLEIAVELAVDIHAVNPFDFFEDERVKQTPFEYPEEFQNEMIPFLRLDGPEIARGPLYEAFSKKLPRKGKTIDLLVELNAAVNQEVDYVIRMEAGVYTPEECLKAGKASCRDSAILLMTILRERGIAARFASGYLIQLTDEGMIPDQPKGMDHDVADLHAWCEVFLPGAGWVGLDATSGLLCGEGHIPLACAAVPSAAAPIIATADLLAEDVSFSMSVARLGHEPRPTTPYTEEVWETLRSQAETADKALRDASVTLTSGGEPTFNSRLHPTEPEWNGEALGPTKWTQGNHLAHELKVRLAPGAALLFKQGKHYPGESLPRWAIEIIGRRDGGIVWRDLGDQVTTEATVDAARRFAEAFARKLNITNGLTSAYEDPWRFLQHEAALPEDVDPHSADLKDPEERRRLARVLDRGLKTEAGFLIPLANYGDGWTTAEWSFRRGRCYLMEGDSPMGLRLPLNSLGTRFDWTPIPFEEGFDPKDPRILTDEEIERERRRRGEKAREESEWKASEEPGFVTVAGGEMRTAICFEARGDSLFAFLPPLSTTDQWFELVRIIDECREVTGLDIKLEGYPPQSHPILYRFVVTPDPGVLEVNLPVSQGSAEYTSLVQHVFDAALHCGLHSEKYLLDGRMAGSGGGNHLTLGGPSALQSPFTTRTDILANVLTFFQHHPSLSYLFSGLFVGPTSQSPRVDEARHDTLYELEIALKHARNQQGFVPPWLNDQLYRNLLTDLTGNTHRTEISIDKLFDWRTPTGRQGILEFRGFEMPPHPRMVCAQMYLMRAIVAAMAQGPYDGRLVRWGTRLHDQFLLPYWMWRDFQDVLTFLESRGVGLTEDGYRPFLEQRCPVAGQIVADGVVVEIRNALEPWNVLGEELTGFGTARFVDSSMERIEVRVENLVADRHLILVNGHTLPMKPTGKAGEYVGGVRFRAWAPPHSLHAHIGIHHPIRVDVIDTWGKRSTGACAYHVWHPEGRGYDTPPLTLFEASARRGQRFSVWDPMMFPANGTRVLAHPDAPYTLDLRRFDIDRPMPVEEALEG